MATTHSYVPNQTYKLNQVQDAITTIVVALQHAGDEVAGRLKRLRDADRAAGQGARRSFPAAFQAAASGGRGIDAVLTPYDAFALWLGWQLLDLSYSQTQCALILRAHRSELETVHRRIMREPPLLLRAPDKFAPGRPVFEVENPAFFVISSGWREASSQRSSEMARIIRGEAELFAFFRARVSSNSVLELNQTAWLLHHWLEESPASTRGRS